MKKKRRENPDEILTEQESLEAFIAFVNRTKPENMFPRAYKRFVEHMEMLERTGYVKPMADDKILS